MLRVISALLICSALCAQAPVPDTKLTARTPPRAIRRAPPEYSEEARLAGVSGKAIVRVTVGVDGSVKSFQIVRGIGFGLDEMAEKAVRQWQFQPGQVDGVPISLTSSFGVTFRLPDTPTDFGPTSLIFKNSPANSRPVLIKVPQKLVCNGLQHQPLILDIDVNTQGDCKVVSVVSGSPSDADAVSKNVEQWHFQPAALDGNPVVAHGRLTFLMGQAQDRDGAQQKPPQAESDALRVSPSVSRPQLLHQVDPQYSEEARKAGVSGTVIARIVVGADGTVNSARVVHGIGFGLDEKAEESVRQWQFKPGEKDGVPVAVIANIEVNFRLFSRREHFGPDVLLFALDTGLTRPELLRMPAKVADDGTDRDAVVLDIAVDTDGKCTVSGVIRGAPDDAGAVSKNVEKWRFRPAELNGKPIAVQGRLRYLLGKKDQSFVDPPAPSVH